MGQSMNTATMALSFVERGWYVLPIFANDKRPYFDLAPAGYKSASNDPAKVEKWFTKNPDLNIGIACAMSGLVVCDVDFRNGGDTDEMPETFTVSTGDGFHYYYKANNDHYAGKLRQGVDVKFNGYVVGAGSTHPNGKFYKIVKDIEPRQMTLL